MAPKEQPGLEAWEGRSQGGKKPGSFLFSYLKKKQQKPNYYIKTHLLETEREKKELLYLVLTYTTHWKPSLILTHSKLCKEPTNIKILNGYRQLSKEKSIKHWVSF